VKRVLLGLAMALVCCGTAMGQQITAYGYSGDITPDSNSSNAIGNHNNTLTL
jgi:hypothetical protein